MKIPFKYYLHDNYNANEMADEIYRQISDKFEGSQEDMVNLIGESRPFYEVELNCEFDTENGDVNIISAL